MLLNNILHHRSSCSTADDDHNTHHDRILDHSHVASVFEQQAPARR
jgi:hypothetical protein